MHGLCHVMRPALYTYIYVVYIPAEDNAIIAAVAVRYTKTTHRNAVA